MYVNNWATKTTSERVRNNHDEDGVFIAMGLLAVDRSPRADKAIGKVSFEALGDSMGVELYDLLQILHGVVPHHPNGMPMQGLLSIRRGFENETSLTHVGVNGELYRSGAESALVSPSPMDLMSKLAVFAYFEMRVDALNSHIH